MGNAHPDTVSINASSYEKWKKCAAVVFLVLFPHRENNQNSNLYPPESESNVILIHEQKTLKESQVMKETRRKEKQNEVRHISEFIGENGK